MSTYVIERTLPGAGGMTDDELRAVAGQSNRAIDEVGPGVRWLHSYVTDDKLYCIYEADNPALIREHGRRGGFPVDVVAEVSRTIDPTTAN
jgi:hypothetical protein